MNDRIKVQAYGKAAPLVRQATSLFKERRKYSRQANRFTNIRMGAMAFTSSIDPQIVSEARAVVDAIETLRPDATGFRQQAATLLVDLEDVLSVSSMRELELEIVPVDATLYHGDDLLFRICNGIMKLESFLSEPCGPAPAGWPGAEDGASFLVDDSEINALEKRVRALQERQQEIDDDTRRRSEEEQAAARQRIEDQKLGVVELALKLQKDGVEPKEIRTRVFARMRHQRPNASPSELSQWWRDSVARELRRHDVKKIQRK